MAKLELQHGLRNQCEAGNGFFGFAGNRSVQLYRLSHQLHAVAQNADSYGFFEAMHHIHMAFLRCGFKELQFRIHNSTTVELIHDDFSEYEPVPYSGLYLRFLDGRFLLTERT